MGFSMKMAPGVRVRVSSRGVRTSVGPRAARVHVGAGRSGLSTGAGPLGFYTALSSTRRATDAPPRSVTAPPPPSSAMTPAARAKAVEADRLAAAFDHIHALPRQDCPVLRRPSAPLPPPIDESAIRHAHRGLATRETHIWNRRARRRAIETADAEADAEVAHLRREYSERPKLWQQHLDRTWEALGANDPQVLLATLADAFEDNEGPAAAIGVAGDEVSLLVMVPRVSEVVPPRRPTTTAAGNLSLKKLTKREAADTYTLVVSGHVLATVKECFAVGRGLRSARVIAVRPNERFMRTTPEVVMAASVQRDQLVGVAWDLCDPLSVLSDWRSDLLIRQKGVAKELQPLDLSEHPDLQEVVRAIDLDDFPSSDPEGTSW